MCCHSIKLLQSVAYLLLGLISTLGILVYLLLSIPVFVYRLIITKLVAPCFHPRIGKAVTVNGNAIAAEFLRSKSRIASRCAIIINCIFGGTVPFAEFTKLVKLNWIEAKQKRNNARLQYPEFQQYIESWLGFMFWKLDMSFSIKNHVKLHIIPENVSEEEAEQFVCDLTEELLNKPFPLKRSPWEVHLIQNYKSKELNPLLEHVKNSLNENPDRRMTVVIFRFHHAIGDGFALMHAVTAGLFGTPLTSAGIAEPSAFKKSFAEKVLRLIMLPFRFLVDLGYNAAIILNPGKTQWNISDADKSWHHIYGRSKLIPVEKIKYIKSKLQVSFAAVILSAVTAAVSEETQQQPNRSSKDMKILNAWTPLPKSARPTKLRNNFAGTILQLPVVQRLGSLKRLQKCQEQIYCAKHSLSPLITTLILKLFSFQFAHFARLVLKNKIVPMGISSFPGPSIPVQLLGRQGVTADFCGGLMEGDAGVGFLIFSYNKYIRIAITAENAVMNRLELSKQLERIYKEIDALYELALEENTVV